MMVTLHTPLAVRLERAALDLHDARVAHLGSATQHAEAKRALDLATAQRTTEGIGGRNQAERDANLRLDLATHFDALHAAEDELAEARCRLECADTEFQVARYLIRLTACKGVAA